MSPMVTGVGGVVLRSKIGYPPVFMDRLTSKGEPCGMRMVRGRGPWEVKVKLSVGGVGEEKW